MINPLPPASRSWAPCGQTIIWCWYHWYHFHMVDGSAFYTSELVQDFVHQQSVQFIFDDLSESSWLQSSTFSMNKKEWRTQLLEVWISSMLATSGLECSAGRCLTGMGYLWFGCAQMWCSDVVYNNYACEFVWIQSFTQKILRQHEHVTLMSLSSSTYSESRHRKAPRTYPLSVSAF